MCMRLFYLYHRSGMVNVVHSVIKYQLTSTQVMGDLGELWAAYMFCNSICSLQYASRTSERHHASCASTS